MIFLILSLFVGVQNGSFAGTSHDGHADGHAKDHGHHRAKSKGHHHDDGHGDRHDGHGGHHHKDHGKKSSAKAHVHGMASGSLVLENGKVRVELEIPSVDIFSEENVKKLKSPAFKEQREAFKKHLMATSFSGTKCVSQSGAKVVIAGEGNHSSVSVVMTWECEKLSALKKIGFTFLPKYRSLKDLKLQVLSEKGMRLENLGGKKYEVLGF